MGPQTLQPDHGQHDREFPRNQGDGLNLKAGFLSDNLERTGRYNAGPTRWL